MIIDADVAHLFSPMTESAKPVWKWIQSGNGRLVTGGDNKRELASIGVTRRLLTVLQRAGRLIEVREGALLTEVATDCMLNHCHSNDKHIVALARITGARLVYSRDQALHADLRNAQLLSNPRGRIYQDPRHAHLFRKSNCAVR